MFVMVFRILLVFESCGMISEGQEFVGIVFGLLIEIEQGFLVCFLRQRKPDMGSWGFWYEEIGVCGGGFISLLW